MIGAYWFCVALGAAWVLVSVLLGHAGHDLGHGLGHGTRHVHAGEAGDGHLPLFSPTVLATFVAAFGGVGLVGATVFGSERTALHLPLAAGGACALALSVAALLARLSAAMESDSTVRLAALRGAEAEVITGIPAAGLGEVAYVAGGVRCTSPARTLDDGPLCAGTRVRIERVERGTCLVLPASPETT